MNFSFVGLHVPVTGAAGVNMASNSKHPYGGSPFERIVMMSSLAAPLAVPCRRLRGARAGATTD